MIVGVYPPAILDAFYYEAAAVCLFTTTRPDPAAASFYSLGTDYYAPTAIYYCLLPAVLSDLEGVFVTFRFERFPTSENWGAIILRIRF